MLLCISSIPESAMGTTGCGRTCADASGAHPSGSHPEKGQAAESRRAEAKYIIRCESCGRESRYMRRGKAVDLLLRGRGRALRCTGCGGSSFKLFVRK